MNLGKRHLGAPSVGRYAALLVSVIALALALFAVPAQAEECTSSSCVQYNPELPSAEGGHTPKHHQETQAEASRRGNGGGTAPNSPSERGSNEGEEAEESESSPKQGGLAPGGNGGSGQGKAGGSAKSGAKKAANSPPQTVSAKPASHSDSGSSPLVPILIAIAVLAAISVAVVMIRQRRQRNDGGPSAAASPEAN